MIYDLWYCFHLKHKIWMYISQHNTWLDSKKFPERFSLCLIGHRLIVKVSAEVPKAASLIELIPIIVTVRQVNHTEITTKIQYNKDWKTKLIKKKNEVSNIWSNKSHVTIITFEGVYIRDLH